MALVSEIARQKGTKKPFEVRELLLDKCSVAKLKGNEFDGFVNLEVLSLNNVGLTTLENFPPLVRLKRLELNDNKISGGLDVLQELSLISLSTLSLSGNRIKSLSELEPLGGLPNLKVLDLEHCDVTSAPGYREKVFEMIPALKVLDNADANGEPADLDEDDDDEDADAEEDDEDDDDLEPEDVVEVRAPGRTRCQPTAGAVGGRAGGAEGRRVGVPCRALRIDRSVRISLIRSHRIRSQRHRDAVRSEKFCFSPRREVSDIS